MAGQFSELEGQYQVARLTKSAFPPSLLAGYEQLLHFAEKEDLSAFLPRIQARIEKLTTVKQKKPTSKVPDFSEPNLFFSI